jgi:hypothetical protein
VLAVSLSLNLVKRTLTMILFAHHVAVELFGREYSPHTPFEHVCAFTVVGLILLTSAVGTWTIASKIVTHVKRQRGLS